MTDLFPLIRTPHFRLYDTFPKLHRSFSHPKAHTVYTVQPQGLPVTMPVWDATKAT